MVDAASIRRLSLKADCRVTPQLRTFGNRALYQSNDLNHWWSMSIPSDEDFARAQANMAKRNEHWAEISASAQRKLRRIANLHNFVIVPQERCRYHAIVFLSTDRELVDEISSDFMIVANGIIKNAVMEFRGVECQECDVEVELDSYENVKRNFAGNYFNRLR